MLLSCWVLLVLAEVHISKCCICTRRFLARCYFYLQRCISANVAYALIAFLLGGATSTSRGVQFCNSDARWHPLICAPHFADWAPEIGLDLSKISSRFFRNFCDILVSSFIQNVTEKAQLLKFCVNYRRGSLIANRIIRAHNWAMTLAEIRATRANNEWGK